MTSVTAAARKEQIKQQETTGLKYLDLVTAGNKSNLSCYLVRNGKMNKIFITVYNSSKIKCTIL